MRISVFVPDLRGGGAERVNLLLLLEFVRRGYSVDLIVLRRQGALLEQVPATVRIIDLKADRIRQGMMPLIRYLQEVQPDALMASMWPLTTLAVLCVKLIRFRGRLILSEHSSLSLSPQNSGLSGRALRASMRWANSKADEVVGVSAGVLKDLHGLGLPKDFGKVIHNPIVLSSERLLPESKNCRSWIDHAPGRRVLAVGSLKSAKDYPTMLRAVRRVVDSCGNISLLILGTGPLQNDLEGLICSLGLDDHVHFGGFVSDPGPFYRAAGLFVLSSAWEGFGNVIVEAMAAGTPVVSTDCRSGPAEILENGRYGRLVPVGDYEALAEAIIESLDAKHDTEALQARAADFSVEKIGQEYLKLLTS